MQLSIFPWNLRAWSRLIRATGYPGLAVIALLIAEFGQFGNAAISAHSSTTALVLIRGPFTVLAILLLLVNFKPPTFRVKSFSTAFLVFGIFFLISTAWSEEPVATFGKAVEILVGLFVVLRTAKGPNAIEKLNALRQLLLLFISALCSIAVGGYLLGIDLFILPRPSIFFSTTADAPFLSGNGLGYVASALLLTVFAEWQAGSLKRTKAVPQLAYAGFIFLFATSRTSLLILAVGIAVVFFWRSKVLFLGFLITSAGVGYFYWDKILRALQGNQTQGNFETLSGRTIIWAAAFNDWKQHPLLGFGGGSGGKFVLAHLGNESLEVLSSLHDGFLELLTGLGAVGFTFVVLLLIGVSIAVVRAWRRDPRMGGAYVLIVHIWITSIMSLGVLAWMNYEMLFYLVLIVMMDVKRRQSRLTVPSTATRVLRPHRRRSAVMARSYP